MNPKLVTYYNLPTEKGVVVTNVFSGGEAEKSGLEIADIIIRLDDVDINNVRDLIKVMNKHAVGDKVRLELFRGQGKVQLEIVLEKAPTPPLSPPAQPGPQPI